VTDRIQSAKGGSFEPISGCRLGALGCVGIRSFAIAVGIMYPLVAENAPAKQSFASLYRVHVALTSSIGTSA
jgi:hypothetical protein